MGPRSARRSVAPLGIDEAHPQQEVISVACQQRAERLINTGAEGCMLFPLPFVGVFRGPHVSHMQLQHPAPPSWLLLGQLAPLEGSCCVGASSSFNQSLASLSVVPNENAQLL